MKSGWNKLSEVGYPKESGEYICFSSYGKRSAHYSKEWSGCFQDRATGNDEGMVNMDGKEFVVTHWHHMPEDPHVKESIASGWYKVKRLGDWYVVKYDSVSGLWDVAGFIASSDTHQLAEIGPMVMTLDGELCAGGAQHDPVFNTKQEG